VTAGEGDAPKRDETLVCGQGPLYRRAPVGSRPLFCPGDEPRQGGWELVVEQLAAARVSSRLGRVTKPQPSQAKASRRAHGTTRAAARACGFTVLLLNLSIGASQGSLFKLIALLVINLFGTNHFCT